MELKIRWKKVVGGVLLGLVSLFFVGLLVICVGLQAALIIIGTSTLLAAVIFLAAHLLLDD